MSQVLISVVIPMRNEASNLVKTLISIYESRKTNHKIEIIVVDDASEKDNNLNNLPIQHNISIKTYRLNKRVGVPCARNIGVNKASGEIIFITDSHVSFSEGWDEYIINNIKDNQIIAATICDTLSSFKGYGCSLVVPFMGTKWNREQSIEKESFVQIASCAGTILKKDLFKKIGGYDSGMILYGGAEPEFSIRAWLSGAEIVSAPSLKVHHKFKNQEEINIFLNGLRPTLIHNNLRFGLLYLSEKASLQMIRYFSLLYSEINMQKAIKLLESSNVWERKAELEERLYYDFQWFVRKFCLKNQINRDVLV